MFDFSRVRFERVGVLVTEFKDLLEDAGQLPEIVVREMTADEKRDVVRSTTVRGRYAFYDMALVVFYGALQPEPEESEPDVKANTNGAGPGGLATTGKGRRLFRSTDQVRDLPGEYDPAIVRLANQILELSGLRTKEASENTELELQKKG